MKDSYGDLPVVQGVLVSMFDLAGIDLHRSARASQNEGLLDRYTESFDWLFYRQGRRSTLPSMRRIVLSPVPGIELCDGVSLLVDEPSRCGVLSVWRSFHSNPTPAEVHRLAWINSGNDISLCARALSIDVPEIERMYPYTAVRLDVTDVVEYCRSHPLQVARVFTADIEQEEEQFLIDAVGSSLSRRKKERLFVRWTNGMSLYDTGWDEWDLAATRGAQLFEYLILRRRQLRSLVDDADDAFRRLTLARPSAMLAASAVINSHSRVEAALLTVPAQSVEAARVIGEASALFGLNRSLDDATRRIDLLERRLQWIKAQWLFILGGGVFLINTVIALIALVRH